MLNKSLGKSVLMTALITGSVIWGGTVVHAEEPQQFLLDEYVVTATRMENKLVDTPANMSVITSEEFEKRNYQSVRSFRKCSWCYCKTQWIFRWRSTYLFKW